MHIHTSGIYTDEEMIPLSGIQHFMFCPRQWALIHVEQAWEENLLTAEGSLRHSNVDNPGVRETNGSHTITLRGLHLSSPALGLSGIADAVEIIPEDGAPAKKEDLIRSKRFTVLPVEYKHGKSKANDCDRLQVTAQAIMLEEMFKVKIDQAAIFYWQVRRREYFHITTQLRTQVERCSQQMHHLFKEGITPRVRKQPHCKSCSLINLCMPSLEKLNATSYIISHFDEEAT